MVTYEDLLESTKEAQGKFLETKVGARVKGATVADPLDKKLDDCRQSQKCSSKNGRGKGSENLELSSNDPHQKQE